MSIVNLFAYLYETLMIKYQICLELPHELIEIVLEFEELLLISRYFIFYQLLPVNIKAIYILSSLLIIQADTI